MRFMLLALLLLASPVMAAETLTLTAPITTPTITDWRPVKIALDWENQSVQVLFRGPAGESKSCQEVGAAATATMVALNKANLTANSLHKRTITWAQGLGCLGTGTVSGTPD